MRFEFVVSYHTFGDLILYPEGWQVSTPGHDDPIFVAQSGTDDNPAINDSLLGVGYNPGVGADLYITNGEFTDWAYGELGIPSYTVELTFGSDLDGMNFYTAEAKLEPQERKAWGYYHGGIRRYFKTDFEPGTHVQDTRIAIRPAAEAARGGESSTTSRPRGGSARGGPSAATTASPS